MSRVIDNMPFTERIHVRVKSDRRWPEKFKDMITPFNIVAAIILAVGLPLTFIRFTQGIGAVSNLTNNNPWGVWIGVDVMAGVALAAGGFVIGTAVHLFGMEKYKPIVRPAILTGFLGYAFVVVGLCFDLGRPWRLPFPMFVSFGVTSVMFEVGWCVATYLTVLFLEFTPMAFEALGWRKLRNYAIKLTTVTAIAALLLSTLHQSSLGGLFLLAPGKLHPLWYSPYLPFLFLVSAVAAGLTMVIFESMMSHRVFAHQVDENSHKELHDITLGLGKAAAAVLFAYFCFKWLSVAHGNSWHYLNTGMGYWFLLEIFGFVAAPCALFFVGVRRHSVVLIRIAAIMTVLGIILNRVNVAMVAMNWQAAERYIPSWMEIWITMTVITLGLLTFRFLVNHTPILYRHPDFINEPEQ